MSSQTNPLLTSLMPNANPTGTNISVPGLTSGVGLSSMYPQIGMSASLTGADNPVWNAGSSSGTANPVPSSMPSFSAYGFNSPSPTGGAVPSSTLGTIGTNIPGTFEGASYGGGGGPLGLGETFAGAQQLQHNLGKVFGSGVGDAITQFLMSGAGYSPQILQQLFAQLQPGFAQQQQNLLGEFSAGGNRFGSGSQIGYADLLGQQSLTEGDVAANLYENAVSNYINVLMGSSAAAANEKARQPTTWDAISGIMSLISAGGSAGTAAGIGGGSGTISSILSGLEAL
jgi:hypothetical protein